MVTFKEWWTSAVEYGQYHNLSKLTFTEDLENIGLLFLENGRLFTISRTEAYHSIITYDDNLKQLFMSLIDMTSNSFNSSHKIAFTHSLIDRIKKNLK